MKKVTMVVLLSVFVLIVPSGNLFAGSSVGRDGVNDFSSGNNPKDLAGISDLKVVPDNYGGFLYYYKDKEGNSCVSNTLGNTGGHIVLAKADKASSRVSESNKASHDTEMDDFDMGAPQAAIADPFEPINRVFFHFNDKLYFWVIKPIATGYNAVVPRLARKGVRNFFDNILFPVRFVNCLFQGKFKGAGYELGRFMINSTLGLAGFMDSASSRFKMQEHDEDLGLTFRSYGIGQGFFIDWPILGASTLTDTIGDVGDAFLDPINYLNTETKYILAIKAYSKVNGISLKIGDYEELKKMALDPYIAYRNAYIQLRQNQTEK